MAEEKIGIFRALWRFVSFWKVRKALGLVRAADRQFTGSVRGISDAFDIQRDDMVKQYKGLRDAIAQVESVIEDKRMRLSKLNDEENELIQKREGALAKAEEAQLAGDARAMEKHTAAFERFDNRIANIEEEQAKLTQEVEATSQTMERYMLQLTKMQSEIEKLPHEKAKAVADYVSSKRIIELNERLAGIKTSIERGPVDAVLKANKELTAKARISEKLTGADVTLQDEQYARAGKASSARERMQRMLAARKAEREAKTGGEKQQEKRTDDRPEI